MTRRQRTKAVIGAAVAAMLTISLSIAPAQATDERSVTSGASVSKAITPVAATKTGISFGSCHFQKTPPYEPRVRLECDSGEVVVAVFEDGIRCCQLELK